MERPISAAGKTPDSGHRQAQQPCRPWIRRSPHPRLKKNGRHQDVLLRKCEPRHDAPPPRQAQRAFHHPMARIGVDEDWRRRRYAPRCPDAWPPRPSRIRNSSTSPGASRAEALGSRCRCAACHSASIALRLGPVHRIGGRRLRLGAQHLAPDSAQQAQAIRARPLAGRLMQIGRSDPAPRRCHDHASCRRRSSPASPVQAARSRTDR